VRLSTLLCDGDSGRMCVLSRVGCSQLEAAAFCELYHTAGSICSGLPYVDVLRSVVVLLHDVQASQLEDPISNRQDINCYCSGLGTVSMPI